MNLKFTAFLILSLAFFYNASAEELLEPCPSEVYCFGDLIKTVQLSHNESVDDKVFVDLALKKSPAEILQLFTDLNIVGDQQDNETTLALLNQFVQDNFENGTEFEDWVPGDWIANPTFLAGITDTNFKTWASQLHEFWHELGRKIKEDVKTNSDRYSMHYVSHPVIVPGGRFKEFYYWDSYWIQKGLIVSEMTVTVQGMIENFLEMVNSIGYIPNGGRIYYERSQPPLLLPMIKNYYYATGNVTFIQNNIAMMETEFDFFMNNRTVSVMKGANIYQMAIYKVDRKGPRPESYSKDYRLVENLNITQAEKDIVYANLKAGAESGWDFSSRWFIAPEGEKANLSHVKTMDIVPVDLNGFLYWNAIIFEEFCELVKDTHTCTRDYADVAAKLKTAIRDVLWDEERGSWFDYDRIRQTPRKEFYPTNIVPLWVKAHHPEAVERIVQYFVDENAVDIAGVPSSSLQTGEQWDYPNGWAPLNHMVVEALEYSGNQVAQDLAFDIAQRWTRTNYWAYDKYGYMFEKYDVSCLGCAGGGGEYEVVIGFGWSNGVVLDFLKMYGNRLTAGSGPPSEKPTTENLNSGAITIRFETLSALLVLLSVARSYVFV